MKMLFAYLHSSESSHIQHDKNIYLEHYGYTSNHRNVEVSTCNYAEAHTVVLAQKFALRIAYTEILWLTLFMCICPYVHRNPYLFRRLESTFSHSKLAAAHVINK